MIRFWPRSLFGRNLLLLSVLVVVVQVASLAAYILIQRPRVIELAMLVASQVNTLDTVLAEVPPQGRADFIARINRDDRMAVYDQAPAGQARLPSAPLAQVFVNTLQQHLRPGIDYRWEGSPQTRLWIHVDIAGQPAWLTLPAERMLFPNQWLTHGLLLFSSIVPLAALVALLLQRRINLPLKRISAAARNLGAGGHPERLPDGGPAELAAVARQFNAMLDSLEAMEDSRALMLAGISHDLRTPLTKLRLSLALGGRQEGDEVARYFEQVEDIIGQFLDYGRSGTGERPVLLDLNTLVMQLAGEYEARGVAFTLSLAPLLTMYLHPVAMQRLIANLMENAVKYAGKGMQVRTARCDGKVRIMVLDRGPGLREEQIPSLLRPFARGDAGRSSTSGTGLGLTIVERLARQHGGTLQLCPRRHGGLCAMVEFPLPAHEPAAGV